jgi:hypothetical protein
MTVFNSRALVLAVLLAASLGASACRRTYVIVPRPAEGYSPTDTLRGRSDGRDVRVTFHFDTTWRVDTVTRLDTLWRGGTRVIERVDTLRLGGTDTVYRRSALPAPRPGMIPNAPTRADTIRVTTSDTVRITRNDTIVVTVRDTIRLTVRDTLWLVQRDTIVRTDTVRLAGRRMLFVPPGQYPPAGQCRVWIHDRPPGQQARAAPCDALGTIPAGAFILFGGEAWDADFDWGAEAQRGGVPPEIIALTRQRDRRR